MPRTGFRDALSIGVRAPQAPAQYDQNNEAQFRAMVEQVFASLQRAPVPPRIESVDLTFDGDALSLKAIGGPEVMTALFEIADNADFTDPIVSTTEALTVGAAHTESSSSLAAADRDKKWYGRVTPYSRAATGGAWPGVPVQDAEYVGVLASAKTPRITNASVAQVVQGTCSTSLPLKNRVTVAFIDDDVAGYTWKCTRYENSVAVLLIDSGIALSTTTLDDEIAAEADVGGSDGGAIIYLVEITGSSGVVDSKWTQTLNQPRTDC
jgi:hypothetical protein